MYFKGQCVDLRMKIMPIFLILHDLNPQLKCYLVEPYIVNVAAQYLNFKISYVYFITLYKCR